ncbi:MAG: PadR family transcriptional regulator [Bacteroidetes bacterium]|nr:PadR family transcriptional regulator [Bacteroidota bacterium]
MKIQAYIIGFLLRHGPMHGYKLIQVIREQTSLFSEVKQPTLYYHLEKLKEKGLLEMQSEQEGKRPERAVYSVTEKGKQQLQVLLREMLAESYQPEFAVDNVLFFGDMIQTNELLDALSKRENELAAVLNEVKIRKEEYLRLVTQRQWQHISAIFAHRILHLEAEIRWLKETSYGIIRNR